MGRGERPIFLFQFFVAIFAVAAIATAGGVSMIARDSAGAAVGAHGVEGVKKFGAEVLGKINLKDPVAIFQETIRGARPKFLFHQDTVCHQLHRIGGARFGRGARGFDLDGNHRTVFSLHNIVGLAGEAVLT